MELRQKLAQRRGKPVSHASLQRALRQLGLRKRRARPAPHPSADSAAPPASPPRYQPAHQHLPPTEGAYPGDLSDAQWAVVQPLIEPTGARGRPPTQDRRRVLDALFYMARTGCQWRMLPHDYPPWQTIAS